MNNPMEIPGVQGKPYVWQPTPYEPIMVTDIRIGDVIEIHEITDFFRDEETDELVVDEIEFATRVMEIQWVWNAPGELRIDHTAGYSWLEKSGQVLLMARLPDSVPAEPTDLDAGYLG